MKGVVVNDRFRELLEKVKNKHPGFEVVYEEPPCRRKKKDLIKIVFNYLKESGQDFYDILHLSAIERSMDVDEFSEKMQVWNVTSLTRTSWYITPWIPYQCYIVLHCELCFIDSHHVCLECQSSTKRGRHVAFKQHAGQCRQWKDPIRVRSVQPSHGMPSKYWVYFTTLSSINESSKYLDSRGRYLLNQWQKQELLQWKWGDPIICWCVISLVMFSIGYGYFSMKDIYTVLRRMKMDRI